MNDESSDLAGFVTISELARLRGVDKSAISRRVVRLEAQGLIETRRGNGSTKLVNVAAFDRAAGQTVDAIREQNGRGASLAAIGAPDAALPGDPILAREQARRASYDADLKKLDLDQRLGLLIPIDQVRDAMAACGQAMGRLVDQMPTKAEEIAAAVARDGAPGARAILKTLSRELRAELARALARLGEVEDEAPGPADAEAEAEAEATAA